VITELYVANNDMVKKGDPLFHIESTATDDQQKAAYASYTAGLNALQTAQNTKQSLDAAMWTKQQAYITAQNTQNYRINHAQNPATKSDYTDLEKMQIDSAVVQTQKDFDAAQQAYKTADVAVNAANAQVSTTQSLYQETQSATVTAPIGGQVVNLLVNNGDQVSGAVSQSSVNPTSSPSQTNLGSNKASPVLVIANLGNPFISASISEDYETRVKTGQKVSIVFDSLKDQTFTGTVQNLATVGSTSQGIVTYDARIVAANLPTSIKPGMTALITIETLRRDDVLDVPKSAVQTGSEGTYVVAAKTHQHIGVTVGTKGVAKTEITRGLSEGTQIVASP
jgi:multidrug efflux pump subunit AcrA (membrane-fusion protein)